MKIPNIILPNNNFDYDDKNKSISIGLKKSRNEESSVVITVLYSTEKIHCRTTILTDQQINSVL